MRNKELIVRYRADSEEWSVIYVFNRIYKVLVENYPEINITYEPIKEFIHYEGAPRHSSFIIENPSNKKIILLTYDDVPRDIIKQTAGTGWIVSNIKQMFCVSNICDIIERKDYYKEFSNIEVDSIIKPFCYTTYRTSFDKDYADQAHESKSSSKYREQAMLFRGLFYGEREYYSQKNTHPEITCTNAYYKALPDYVKELVSYRCGLSFTGAAEICHRDLEYLALGIPIIRPELKNTQFKNPLVSGQHYIGVEGTSYEEKMQAINAKWEEVKNNYDLLDYIGNNAREWYLINGRLDSQVELFIKCADLKLITE